MEPVGTKVPQMIYDPREAMNSDPTVIILKPLVIDQDTFIDAIKRAAKDKPPKPYGKPRRYSENALTYENEDDRPTIS